MANMAQGLLRERDSWIRYVVERVGKEREDSDGDDVKDNNDDDDNDATTTPSQQ